MVHVTDPIQVRGAVIPADELSWRFSRSSGPGGQSVNTSDSRVELSYDLASSTALGPVLKERALRALAGRLAGGVLTVTASEFRSQLRNREAAARRLAAVLTAATAPPARARAADQAHPRVHGAAASRQAAPLRDQTPPPFHRRVNVARAVARASVG
jgi:ribosome-associated protein